jgi:hypothetical protein
MSHRSPRLRAAAASVAALALGAPLVAQAANPRDTLVRDRISFTTKAGKVQSGASASYFTPSDWKRTAGTAASRAYRATSTGLCVFTVTVSTRIAPDKDETASAHVEAATPFQRPGYVIDAGTRNTEAWRVVRLPGTRTDPRVRLSAMHAVRNRLGTNEHAWHETRVTAISRKGDECHSGTYRDVLGPQIGNLLATATGRIYRFTTH